MEKLSHRPGQIYWSEVGLFIEEIQMYRFSFNIKCSKTCSEWGLWIILSNRLECALENVSSVSQVVSTTNDIPFTSIISAVPKLSVGDLWRPGKTICAYRYGRSECMCFCALGDLAVQTLSVIVSSLAKYKRAYFCNVTVTICQKCLRTITRSDLQVRRGSLHSSLASTTMTHDEPSVHLRRIP